MTKFGELGKAPDVVKPSQGFGQADILFAPFQFMGDEPCVRGHGPGVDLFQNQRRRKIRRCRTKAIHEFFKPCLDLDEQFAVHFRGLG